MPNKMLVKLPRPNFKSTCVLIVLLLFADGRARAKSDSAATDNLAQAVATVEALRAAARNQPAGTMERLALPKAREQFNKLTKELFKKGYPAVTFVEVSHLARPQSLIEIQPIAVIP